MTKPILIYGASGYTGKLIAEYLVKAGLPFTAAGRNTQRVVDAMEASPGVAGADYDVLEVQHEQAELEEAFRGRNVVINVVGPFGQLAEPVIKAAVAAKVHYVDTTGEQDWVKHLRDDYAADFARNDRVCSPALSWMWTGGNIAAEIALETEGVDSLDILYAPNGAPTVASTLSFLRMVTQPQYKLVDNFIETWEPATTTQVASPHSVELLVGLPWGGGCEPLWYEHDERVRNCRVQVGFAPGPLVDFVVKCMTDYVEAAKTKSSEELEALTNSWGEAIAVTPPREIDTLNRCLVSCRARGTMIGRTHEFYGTGPYKQTGALMAEGCRQLLEGSQRATGFLAPASAFGARELGNAMHALGLHEHIA